MLEKTEFALLCNVYESYMQICQVNGNKSEFPWKEINRKINSVVGIDDSKMKN